MPAIVHTAVISSAAVRHSPASQASELPSPPRSATPLLLEAAAQPPSRVQRLLGRQAPPADAPSGDLPSRLAALSPSEADKLIQEVAHRAAKRYISKSAPSLQSAFAADEAYAMAEAHELFLDDCARPWLRHKAFASRVEETLFLLPKLQRLSLFNLGLSPSIFVPRLLPQLSQLHSLNFSLNRSGDDMAACLAAAPLPHLQYLELSYCRLLSNQFLMDLPSHNLPRLHTLDLAYNNITARGLRKGNLRTLPALRTLLLNHCPLNDGYNFEDAMADLQKLRYLDIRGTSQASDAKTIARVQRDHASLRTVLCYDP